MKRLIIDILLNVVTFMLAGGVVVGGFMIHDGLGVILLSAGALWLWDQVLRVLP